MAAVFRLLATLRDALAPRTRQCCPKGAVFFDDLNPYRRCCCSACSICHSIGARASTESSKSSGLIDKLTDNAVNSAALLRGTGRSQRFMVVSAVCANVRLAMGMDCCLSPGPGFFRFAQKHRLYGYNQNAVGFSELLRPDLLID